MKTIKIIPIFILTLILASCSSSMQEKAEIHLEEIANNLFGSNQKVIDVFNEIEGGSIDDAQLNEKIQELWQEVFGKDISERYLSDFTSYYGTFPVKIKRANLNSYVDSVFLEIQEKKASFKINITITDETENSTAFELSGNIQLDDEGKIDYLKFNESSMKKLSDLIRKRTE